MKKLLITFSLIFGLISSSFAGFFDSRFFEVKVDLGVELANNTVAVLDYFVENPVIDLSKIAADVPDSGFNITANVKPELDITLNIPRGLYFGVQVGVQAYSSVGISKSFFELLGEGWDFSEEDFEISMPNTYADVFTSVSVPFGWNGERLKWRLVPSIYAAVAHAVNDGSYVKASNQTAEDGSVTFGYDFYGNAALYTPVAISNTIFNDPWALAAQIWNAAGFDLGLAVDYDLMKYLTLSGSVRVPIKPSTLYYKTGATVSSSYTTSVSAVTSGSTGSPEFATSMANSEEISGYTIHRPMKFTLDANLHPFGRFLTMFGGVGIGIEHPFAADSSEIGWYMDYNVGARLSLLNLLSLTVTVERTDQIYVNKAILALNLRLVEVDVGIAAEGTSFARSFTGAGFGAFATVCVGF